MSRLRPERVEAMRREVLVERYHGPIVGRYVEELLEDRIEWWRTAPVSAELKRLMRSARAAQIYEHVKIDRVTGPCLERYLDELIRDYEARERLRTAAAG